MPGPVIFKWISDRQLASLNEQGELILFSKHFFEEKTHLMIWDENNAEWVHALITKTFTRPNMSQLEVLYSLSGFKTLEEWLNYEAENHGGSLPPYVLHLKKLTIEL
jgi:hypothetical protein